MATQNNKRVLHRKEWQQMTPAPTASVAGSFIIKDPLGIKRTSLYVTSATAQYLYAADEDAYMQVPSMALAGTWAAGACGCWLGWSNTLTANGGGTTYVTTATAINAAAYGNKIRFLTGDNAGLTAVCTGFKITPGGTNILTFSALPNAVASSDTFAVSTGRYVVLNAYTSLAAGVVKTYDPLTGVVTSLGTTGLPAAWATDGKMCATPSYVNTEEDFTGTASAGGATTLTDSTLTMGTNEYLNMWIRTTGGTGSGQVRKIVSNTATEFTVAAWSVTPDATTTYEVMHSFSAGLATSATNTTIVDSGKAWASDQWINYQVRIVAGTGIGQVRSITDNNATSLTVATWTVNPDDTSVYAIEGNDDFIYLAGNAAVAMYRYSLSGATWTTLAPTSARAAVTLTGMSLNWMARGGISTWSDETAILDGRYIYSFRGGASAVCDRFDISGGTAGDGTWYTNTYLGQQETFTTGSAYDADTGRIFIRQNATNRFFYLYVVGNHLYPLTTNTYTDGIALLGDKIFTVAYKAGAGTDTITWLYSLMNTGTALHRIMVY